MCTLLGSWTPNYTHTYTNLHINIWLTARASRRNLIREADDPCSAGELRHCMVLGKH